MENRVPTKPGRIKLTDDSGNVKYYYMERADEPTTEGTPLNAATLFNSTNSSRYACDVPAEAFDLLTKEWQVSVLAANWSDAVNGDGYYTQAVTVESMKEVFKPSFAPLYSAADDVSNVDKAFNVIKRMITADGSVEFLAKEKPASDITIRIWRV